MPDNFCCQLRISALGVFHNNVAGLKNCCMQYDREIVITISTLILSCVEMVISISLSAQNPMSPNPSFAATNFSLPT